MSTLQGERELIHRAAGGDADAFASLMTAYQKQVYNLALRMTGSPDDALDLSQEAFLRAWRGLGSYRSDATFSTWLYRLTSNVCIDFLRRQKRQQTATLFQPGEEDEERELSIPDPGPDTEEQVMARLERARVAAALERLEPEYRQALTLRVVNGLSYTEIAAVLQIREGTVKSRIARAREKMRRIMQKSGNKTGGGSSNQSERGTDAHEL